MKTQPMTWEGEQCKVALKITKQKLMELTGATSEQIDSGEIHGEMKTIGPWSIIKSYRAMATTSQLQAFGIRSLSKPRQSGYCLEGWVSINGKRYSAFTSSQLFELEDGKLVDVAILHARMNKE